MKAFAIKLVLLVILFLKAFYGFSQCNENLLFPYKSQSSKFSITKQLLSDERFYKLIELYDNTDSAGIQTSAMMVHAKTYNCLDGKDITLFFNFNDDKLFRVVIDSEYDLNDFNKCINRYNDVVKYFNSKYKKHAVYPTYQKGIFSQSGESGRLSGGKENGESTVFVKKMSENGKELLDYITVDYHIQYEFNSNNGNPNQDSEISGVINYFDVVITHWELF